MSFRLLIFALLLIIKDSLTCASLVAAEEEVFFSEDSLNIKITCLDESIVHIQVCPKNQNMRQSLVVDDSNFYYWGGQIKDENEKRLLMTSSLIVSYDKIKKTITFVDRKNGEIILSETSRILDPISILGDNAYQLTQTFKLSDNEAIYGLGQYQNGYLNYRGKTVNLVQANREIANPVLVSSSNYVLYWDNYSKTVFSEKGGLATFSSEIGDGIDYYFIYGTSMKEAMAKFRKLTGDVPMLPKSSFGLWVSRERYKTFQEVIDVVAEYRKRKIPLDNVVQDWLYWGEKYTQWNSMTFNPKTHPNPQKTIEKLHRDYNVKFALSVWPGFGKDTQIYQKLDSANVLFDAETWAGYKVVDIYNPIAQKVYWNYLYQGLYTKGVDIWWLDGTEPAFIGGLYQNTQEKAMKKAGLTYWGPIHRYLNTYSLELSKMMFNNLRRLSNKRISILTRSAFAGQQKYATTTWSGDIYASWNVLKKQIPAGLNLCMTGLPYWTTDIGGFRVKSQEKKGGGGTGELSDYFEQTNADDGGYIRGLSDSAYLELYTRWFQYGAFNPIFRVHGTEVPREIWHFGAPGTPFYDAQCDMIRLRYSLLSYIYSMAWSVTRNRTILMRPLALDFSNDRAVRNDASSYMFGDALLVHPITFPMYYNRSGRISEINTLVPIYLPQHTGTYWYDFNSDFIFEGGDTIKYDAPLSVLPLFVKGGTILPINTPAQFATEDNNQEIEIRIYTGENAKFILYEDDNETFDYEKNIYNEIEISWNEQLQELRFSGIRGKRKPLLKHRTFYIKVIKPVEMRQVEIYRSKVIYENSELRIKI